MLDLYCVFTKGCEHNPALRYFRLDEGPTIESTSWMQKHSLNEFSSPSEIKDGMVAS